MDMLKDDKDPSDDYWKDYDDDNEDLDVPKDHLTSRRLIDGINLKDLCDGKEIIFETGKGISDDPLNDDEDIADEITHHDVKRLRENRGAPPLNRSFKEIASGMTNVTEDGLVKKQLVTSGIGKIVPPNAYVTVHYNLYKESCQLPFDSTYLRNRPEKFKLGQGEVILGLDAAVKSMKKNENSIFLIKWQMAFGALGCPDRIEEKCDVVADVTLMNFMEISVDEELKSEGDISQIDFNKFINQAKKLLCNGSEEFSNGYARYAISSYRKALKILNNVRLANEEQESVMLNQKLKCLVNLAICYNRLGRHEQACVACQEALSIDSNSVKAHFHYGKASLALSNFRLARKHLLRANRLKPNDTDINKEIKKLNDKKALHEMQDKMFWKKAFTGEDYQGDAQQEQSSALNNFEKHLLSGLEESLKEDKNYVLPMPVSEPETIICERVAKEMELQMEKHADYYLFKKREEDSCST